MLSGLYLYVLDSEVSQSYQRYSRQVFIYVFFSIECFLLLKVDLSSSQSFPIMKHLVFRGFFNDHSLCWHFVNIAAWLVVKFLKFPLQVLVGHCFLLQCVLGVRIFRRQAFYLRCLYIAILSNNIGSFFKIYIYICIKIWHKVNWIIVKRMIGNEEN